MILAHTVHECLVVLGVFAHTLSNGRPLRVVKQCREYFSVAVVALTTIVGHLPLRHAPSHGVFIAVVGVVGLGAGAGSHTSARHLGGHLLELTHVSHLEEEVAGDVDVATGHRQSHDALVTRLVSDSDESVECLFIDTRGQTSSIVAWLRLGLGLSHRLWLGLGLSLGLRCGLLSLGRHGDSWLGHLFSLSFFGLLDWLGL